MIEDNIPLKKIEDLPVESQFNFRQFKHCLENLSEEDTKLVLIELFKQDLVRKVLYESLLNSQYLTSFIEI